MSTPGQGQGLGAMEAFTQGGVSTMETDEPTMRAVAIGRAPALQKPLGGFSGIQRPAIGVARSKNSFTVTNEWTGVTNAKVWDVKGEDLERVPVDYPLERTHREIECDASQVANRISNALKQLSIETNFDSEKAKAKCRTADLVKFRIRLYAGGVNGQPVVVEVQKRSGSSSSFIKSCRAVLNAAEGKTVITQPKRFPPIGNMKCLAGVNLASSPQQDAENGIQKAMDLFKTNQHDMVVLALQSLRSLTDAVKTSPATAIFVSKSIVIESSYKLKDTLYEYVGLVGEDEESDPTSIKAQQRHLAIAVFANALENCGKDGCLAASFDHDQWLQSTFLPAMLDCVRNAQRCANDAYIACLSLVAMASCSSVAVRLILDAGGNDVLKEALSHGEQFHDLLAKTSLKCLEALS